MQHASARSTPDNGGSDGFYLGGYPYTGVDDQTIFLTTNRPSLFGSGF